MFSNPNVSQCFLASAQAEFNLEFGAKNTVIIPDFVISEDNCIATAGFSVGEIAALVFSKALTFENGSRTTFFLFF